MRDESSTFDGHRVSVWDEGKFWKWMEVMVANSVEVLSATELNTLMVKMINSRLCICFHNKKKINRNTQDNYFTEALTVKKCPRCRENIPLF